MRMPCLSGAAAVLCLHMPSHVCFAVRCNGAPLTLDGWQGYHSLVAHSGGGYLSMLKMNRIKKFLMNYFSLVNI